MKNTMYASCLTLIFTVSVVGTTFAQSGRSRSNSLPASMSHSSNTISGARHMTEGGDALSQPGSVSTHINMDTLTAKQVIGATNFKLGSEVDLPYPSHIRKFTVPTLKEGWIDGVDITPEGNKLRFSQTGYHKGPKMAHKADLTLTFDPKNPQIYTIGKSAVVSIEHLVNGDHEDLTKIDFIFMGSAIKKYTVFFKNYKWEGTFSKAWYVGDDPRYLILEGKLNQGELFTLTVEMPQTRLS